ncbi:MAG: hypothetical protein FJY73_13195 [Candidatus Eisenbacteria bacterium]|nr:hypothetical protein [Candidatus Eisenbacteria bacterium]
MTKNLWLRTIGLLFLALSSCSTRDENTLVGSDFFGRRDWAEPVEDGSKTVVRQDTFFEASVFPGGQEDLLLGRRRKFVFWTAVYFDTLPKEKGEIVEARLTGVPWFAEGDGAARIDRIKKTWNETTASETLDVAVGPDASLAPSLDAEIPIEWVQSWIDSSAGNHGVLLRLGDEDEAFFRFPAREADTTSAGERFRLRVTVADTTGAESTYVSSARLDRFYAFKVEAGSYVAENMGADTLLVGMRESMANQILFDLLLPEELRDAAVNRAEIVLTLARPPSAGADAFSLRASRVLNDTLVADSIVVENAVLGSRTIDAGAVSGDTVAIPLTSIVRNWFSERLWDRRIVVRSSIERARDRCAVFYSTEAPDSLRPRLRLLYTPLRSEDG